jgi:chemotaxis methyl-accepting protein methylase
VNSLDALSSRFHHVVIPHRARRPRATPAPAPVQAAPASSAQVAEAGDEELAFCHWLLRRAGVTADAYRSGTLRRRLPACLRVLRVRRPSDARLAVERNPALIHTAVSTLLVGVTSFFRDAHVFDFLAQELRELRERRERRDGVHVWSAGCSEGHELYSVAILLEEAKLLDRSYLLGTDCRFEAVQRAKSGVYAERELATVPPERRGHFDHDGMRHRVKPRLQSAARFRMADLLAGCEPGVWDFILCRNTTMYMHAGATARLWDRLEGALRTGGLLVLGKAERPSGVKRLVQVAPHIYRRARA